MGATRPTMGLGHVAGRGRTPTDSTLEVSIAATSWHGWLRQSVLYLVVGSLIKCPDTLQQESECFHESWQLLTLSPSCFARCMVPPVIYPVRFSSPHFPFFSLCGMLYLISLSMLLIYNSLPGSVPRPSFRRERVRLSIQHPLVFHQASIWSSGLVSGPTCERAKGFPRTLRSGAMHHPNHI
jgi:hypothetical protein